MRKKLICLVMALSVVALSACGGTDASEEVTSTRNESQAESSEEVEVDTVNGDDTTSAVSESEGDASDAFSSLQEGEEPSDDVETIDAGSESDSEEAVEDEVIDFNNAVKYSASEEVLSGERTFKESIMAASDGVVIGSCLFDDYAASEISAFDISALLRVRYGGEVHINSCSYINEWLKGTPAQVSEVFYEDDMQFIKEGFAVLMDMGVFTQEFVTSSGFDVAELQGIVAGIGQEQ